MMIKDYKLEKELLDEFLSEKTLSWKSFIKAIAVSGVIGK